MSKLTEGARGEDCTLHIYPYCNGNNETVVTCHINCEDKGWSLKSPDFWSVYGCSDCHDVIDGRKKTDLSKDVINDCIMRALYRTMKRRIEQGLIECQ